MRLAFVHQYFDRSDDRWRHGQFRMLAIEHRRAWALIGSRAARDRADDPAELPAGFQTSEFLVEHGF